MKRRTFIKSGIGASAALLPISGQQVELNAQSSTQLIESWTRENDTRIASIFERQTLERDHPFRGGFPDRYGIHHVGRAAGYARNLVTGFISPQSRFHRSTKVADSLQLAIDFMLSQQHGDGTIDLLTTNFHSTPDTGFVVEPLAIGLGCLNLHGGEELNEFRSKTGTFLRRAGQALSRGGIHTPNHRWVVCMALARIHQLFPDEQYLKRIAQWLAEKIDIDPDGQYAEKSTSVYTPLVNRCLITMARILDRPELLAPIRKNLDMTRYFARSNGEVVTDGSRRQDQYQIAKLDRYYYSYRYLALRDNSAPFAAMARFIEETSSPSSLAGNLSYFLEEPAFARELPTGGELLDNYERAFPHSNLIRIRRNKIDVTILGGNNRFMTFQKGSAALQAIRLASAFFGKGQFVAESLQKEEGKYVLRQSLNGPYYQPLPPEFLPNDGDWSKMPKHRRPTSEVQTLNTTITVSENDGQMTVEFDVHGTDHVPLAIELAFRRGGKLTGVRRLENETGVYLLESGRGTYQLGDDIIEFGPGHAAHRWTQLRGASAKLEADSVYLTGYTPFNFELTLP